MALFIQTTPTTLPPLRELAISFDTGQPLRQDNGDFCILEGREAVRVWVWRALQPQNRRFCYAAHTARYGNELAALSGHPMEEAERRMAQIIRSALLVCPYISGVEGFSFQRQEQRLKSAFTVRTIYGELSGESEAEV